jgi:hypothetical protein
MKPTGHVTASEQAYLSECLVSVVRKTGLEIPLPIRFAPLVTVDVTTLSHIFGFPGGSQNAVSAYARRVSRPVSGRGTLLGIPAPRPLAARVRVPTLRWSERVCVCRRSGRASCVVLLFGRPTLFQELINFQTKIFRKHLCIGFPVLLVPVLLPYELPVLVYVEPMLKSSGKRIEIQKAERVELDSLLSRERVPVLYFGPIDSSCFATGSEDSGTSF